MQCEFCSPTSLSLYLDSLQVWSVHNGSLVKFHSGKVALEEPLKLQVRRFSVGGVGRKERRERGKRKYILSPLLLLVYFMMVGLHMVLRSCCKYSFVFCIAGIMIFH